MVGGGEVSSGLHMGKTRGMEHGFKDHMSLERRNDMGEDWNLCLGCSSNASPM